MELRREMADRGENLVVRAEYDLQAGVERHNARAKVGRDMVMLEADDHLDKQAARRMGDLANLLCRQRMYHPAVEWGQRGGRH